MGLGAGSKREILIRYIYIAGGEEFCFKEQEYLQMSRLPVGQKEPKASALWQKIK